jgi:hypothetical protein
MSDNDVGIQHWSLQRIGGGIITDTDGILRLSFQETSVDKYTDAEINDYSMARRSHYHWQPPLCMSLRARASHQAARPYATGVETNDLKGTAGFGFWNAPFALAKRVGRLPEAVWFLYTSPPTQLCLVPDIPGWGWKAQVVHAHRPGAMLALPPTLATVAWARVSGKERPARQWIQRLSGAHEALLEADLSSWNEYRLDWTNEAATFFINGIQVHRVDNPPRGPLGFVAWIDNQYAVATPRGVFRSGVLKTDKQWLDLADISIESL